MENLIYLVPMMGVVGLLYTLIKFRWVSKQDAGSERMKEISTYIAEGAMAFLKATPLLRLLRTIEFSMQACVWVVPLWLNL